MYCPICGYEMTEVISGYRCDWCGKLFTELISVCPICGWQWKKQYIDCPKPTIIEVICPECAKNMY